MTYEEYLEYDKSNILADIGKINIIIWRYGRFINWGRDEAIYMLNIRRQLDQYVFLAAYFFYPQFYRIQFEYQSDWQIIADLQWLRIVLEVELGSKEIVDR